MSLSPAISATSPAAPGPGPHQDVTSGRGIDALMQELSALPPGPARSMLREQVVTALLPVARRLAERLRGYTDSEDLFQVACVGLVRAVDHFDPALGHAFFSYAVPTVVGELRRHVRDHCGDVHVPRRVHEARTHVRRARADLFQRHGRTPSVTELSAHTGMPEKDVRLALQAEKAQHARSIEECVTSGTGLTLADTLGAEDPRLSGVLAKVTVQPLLRRLPERERRIMYLRFFRHMTQQDIADTIGISQMHVSRLLSRSLARLRDDLTHPAPR